MLRCLALLAGSRGGPVAKELPAGVQHVLLLQVRAARAVAAAQAATQPTAKAKRKRSAPTHTQQARRRNRAAPCAAGPADWATLPSHVLEYILKLALTAGTDYPVVAASEGLLYGWRASQREVPTMLSDQYVRPSAAEEDRYAQCVVDVEFKACLQRACDGVRLQLEMQERLEEAARSADIEVCVKDPDGHSGEVVWMASGEWVLVPRQFPRSDRGGQENGQREGRSEIQSGAREVQQGVESGRRRQIKAGCPLWELRQPKRAGYALSQRRPKGGSSGDAVLQSLVRRSRSLTAPAGPRRLLDEQQWAAVRRRLGQDARLSQGVPQLLPSVSEGGLMSLPSIQFFAACASVC
eukprot:SAG11_NODE_2659_length_3120_cov_2.024164_3_plen_352_part_00